MRYATVPIVRATGGLYDTVVDFDARSRSGTGFTFQPFSVAALAMPFAAHFLPTTAMSRASWGCKTGDAGGFRLGGVGACGISTSTGRRRAASSRAGVPFGRKVVRKPGRPARSDAACQRPRILFLIGASGVGKSVAIKHVIGLLRVDRGEIWLDGERIDKLSGTRALPNPPSLCDGVPKLDAV